MAIYYIFFVILFVYSIINRERKLNEEKTNRNICILGFIMILCIIAFRHPSMGCDLCWGKSDGYLDSFDKLSKMSWNKIVTIRFKNYEKGYIIFNKIVGTVFHEYWQFLAICAIISILPIGLYVYKRSKMPLVSISIYVGLPVFLMLFSGLRQSLAISITVISVKFIEEKKFIPFAVAVLLAMMFHKSAIVFIIAYPLYHIKLNDMIKFFCLIAIPVVFLLRKTLFTLLSKILKDEAVITTTGAGTLFIFFILIYLFLIVFNKDDEKQNGLINLCYVACICQAFSGIYNTAMRVGYYFMIYMIIAIPNTIYDLKQKDISGRQEYVLSYLIIVAFFTLFGLSGLSKSSFAMANPYYFFWQMP